MQPKQRMSPWTALFLGVAAVAVAGIVTVCTVATYGIHVADQWGGQLIGVVDTTVQNLPDTLRALPDAVGDVIRYRRAPEYGKQVAVEVSLVEDARGQGPVAVVSIDNQGPEMITLLALRVKALNDDGIPMREWTEYAATPLMVERDCRGPIMPNSKSRYPLRRWRVGQDIKNVEWEIADLWLWPRADRRPISDAD